MNKQVPAKWDATKIEPQKGKRVIITGANSGIGYLTALELARHGADVVLACRSEERGKDAVKKIQEELHLSPEAGSVEFRKLDVSSLASVKAFADEFKSTETRLDVLVNNAGIMAVSYALSVDGFEAQFATNHLGHFALTAQLFKQLKNSESARVVNISSNAHRRAKVDLNEIVASKEKYDGHTVYGNTKLYNLLFTHELNRRMQANGVKNVIATTAHPGFTLTSLGNPLIESSNWFMRQLLKGVVAFATQPTEMGVLPSLYVAAAPGVKANDYFGPDGFGGWRGYPTKEEPVNDSKSEKHAAKLWEVSERFAKINFEF